MSFQRKSKRSKPVDTWLETLGLYRKNVAYDETSLFRAISEQIFESQVFHERVRKECIEYARNNYEKFKYLEKNREKWMRHLSLLEKHMVVCGETEIQIIAKKYNRDMTVFDGRTKTVTDKTDGNCDKKFMLCLTDQDHFDVIYKKEYIDNAGFCQSIVYTVLYEEVFGIKNVDKIVTTMLHDNSHNNFIQSSKDDETNNEKQENSKNCKIVELNGNCSNNNNNVNIAPFPFKVAKALDPTIYRNIEYDSWGELRKEYRLGEWYYGDDKLTLGTKCMFTDPKDHRVYECYIQQFLKQENKCIVYLTSFAEKRRVDYSDLSPENDAKPWPLPYRFAKNLTISSPANHSQTLRKITKRAEREHRRSKSCSEEISVETRSNSVASPDLTTDQVSAYTGVPLQKRRSKLPSPVTTVVEPPIIENNNNNYQSAEADVTYLSPMTPITPDTTHSRFQWDQQQNSQWGYYMPTTNPFIWLPVPQSPHNYNNYNIRNMPSSAPATPNVYPYQEMCPSFPPTYHTPPKQPEPHPDQCQSPPCAGEPKCADAYYPAYGEPRAPPDRLTLITNLTPVNSPVEAYSPVVLLPQVSYTPEVVPQVPVYAGYHPTTPTGGYPPAVTAQGFYFPPPPAGH